MAFSSPFKRSAEPADVISPEGEQPTGEEIVIDAEATEVTEAPSSAPIRRAAAVPEAGETHAVEKRSEREIAVRNVAVATAGGLVAGAATIAVAAVAKSAAKHAQAPTPGLSRRRKKDILESQSFLIDVHVLKSGR
ncbi:MAG: hypothetical protein QM648_02795 [Solirubrobacterales bacterium]